MPRVLNWHRSLAGGKVCRELLNSRQHGTRSYELRTAICLGRLWREQGKGRKARDLVLPIYDWFTEGFDTADLQQAKAFLEDL